MMKNGRKAKPRPGNIPDSFEARFFAEHSKKTDWFLCWEVLIVTVIMLISLLIEFFSDNPQLARGGMQSKVFLFISFVFLTATLVIGFSGSRNFRPWFRYLVSFSVCFANLVTSAYMVYALIPLFLLPIFLSAFYYDSRYTAITTGLLLAARTIGLVFYYKFFLPVDYFYLGDYIYKINSKNLVDAVDFILIAVIGVFCILLSGALRRTMEEKLLKEKEKALIDRDMSTASKIQERMLEKQFPNRPEYEVAAYMKPAKTVGGDFYDFVELGEDRVALVMADVSGKGLQASIYMSQVKALIKVYAQSGYSTDKIAEKANSYLTAGAAKGRLFVTVWVGILDLRTGMLSYTNAGHNPPCILTSGGAYAFMNTEPSFVIGGKPMVRYLETQLKLSPGDKIFLYTDGITEAKNADDSFFGEERLLAALNDFSDAAAEETVEKTKGVLSSYIGNAEQYDDITMLAFSFKAFATEKVKIGRSFPADSEHFNEAMQYIRTECENAGCREGIIKDINVACSELIANICSYAYDGKSGDFEVLVESFGKELKITLKDSGKPFNPLLTDTPDTTVSLSDRDKGGLGIFIVKKLMNDVLYRYENNRNVLVLIKQFQ